VRFPVVLDGIKGYLLFYFHGYILLIDKKSLKPSHLRTYFRATSLAV
jgi:hypothetical protein